MDETRHDAPPPREAPEKVAKAREFCEGLLARLGADVAVEVKETPEQIGVALTPREGNALELGSALVEALLASAVAWPFGEAEEERRERQDNEGG